MPPWASSSAPILRAPVAALAAEQLYLHIFRRDRRRIDDDEGADGALRGRVDAARGELLARAGLAGDEHARIDRRDARDDLLQLMRREGAADDAIRGAGALAQRADLAAQMRGLERALGDEHETIRLEGLLDEVIGAELDGADRRLDIAVAGDHHHRQVFVLLLDDLQHLHAVEARALQPDVEEDEMRAALLDRRQRVVGVLGGAHAMALVAENAGDELSDVFFVVDDENVADHLPHHSRSPRRCACASSPPRRPRRAE